MFFLVLYSLFTAGTSSQHDLVISSSHSTARALSAVPFTEHDITTSASSVRSVYSIDIDGDGDLDVLSASLK